MNILEVRHLTKHYKQLTAVNDISFTVKRGICFGLLGPNGAGKTTTLEMIEGLTEPSAGEILYQGKPRSADFSQSVGIQFQQTALMDYLTTEETLQLFASFYQSPVALSELADLCQLNDFLHRDATKLSGGQRQRLLLALALINDPELVFLDEPTTGLDPQSRRHFWQLIDSIKAKGKTIILTTHYMDEAQQLCDELLIVAKGKIIDQGSPEALLNKHFNFKRLRIQASDIEQTLVNCPFQYEAAGDDIVLFTEELETALAWLGEQHIALGSLRIEQPNLDDLFLKLTGQSLA